MDSLRSLAQMLDLPERTLRRAASEGLIHGERVSPRRYRTSLREESYLRRHWPFLRELRDALRTEPNVRLAVLFGSMATDTASERSDVDVLVEVADDETGRVADLAARLSRRLARDVQVVRRSDAERSPLLMASILDQGRVLVDREARWPALQRTAAQWHRRAREQAVPLEDAAPDIDVDDVEPKP
jgi:predicted nucleotidyltransferase